jgi:hypothetical protein
MQVDAFALLQAARENAVSKVASIEAKRNFWLAYTDLSVAVLGGGGLSQLDGAIVADASGGSTISSKDRTNALSTELPDRLGNGTSRHLHDQRRAQAAAIPEAPTTSSTAMQPPLPPPAGQDYQPVVTLNGWTLPWRMNGDWKEFHLVAEEVTREIAPGMTARLWGYNGQTPGPTIEVVEGDKGAHFRYQQAARAHHDPLAWHAGPEWHGRRWRVTQPHIPAERPSCMSSRLKVAAPSCTTPIQTRWCRWRWE